MRQNFLTAPRPLAVFDELVSTLAESRFSFQEEPLLKGLWEKGEECHLGEDTRFQPTRWGHWCLREQKPANQELLTRLIQSWDGTDLQAMLASLDAQLKAWSIFDLADPRLHWDGERLRMAHLPIYAQEHPGGNCGQGWLPLWRSSQLSPDSESPRPQYLRLRRPARPNQFALYLDCPTELGRPGMLFLCSDSQSHPGGFGWSGHLLSHRADQSLGCLEGELFLKDLFDVIPQVTQPLPEFQVGRPQTGERKRHNSGPRVQNRTLAQWVLDRAGGLYALIDRAAPGDLSLESGESVRAGDCLPAPLGTEGFTFLTDDSRWKLAPPAADRISLFRASDRGKSVLLKTRCLSRSSGRRWLIPPSLREQAEPLTHLGGVSVLSVESGWTSLETSGDGTAFPADLLDGLGLQADLVKPSIQLRGQPPIAMSGNEEVEWPAFLSSGPPDIWIEAFAGQELQDPQLVLFHDEAREAISLHGEPPWRVELLEAEPGEYQAQLVDQQTGFTSTPALFELVTEPTERTHPEVGWADEAGSPLRVETISEEQHSPTILTLLGPPCWPVEIHWEGPNCRSTSHLALDQCGRLSWAKLSAALRLPPAGCKLTFHFRGLDNLNATHSPRPRGQNWSDLNALKQSKFWGLRSLAALSQRWEHLILPVLSVAGLKPMRRSENLWELHREGELAKYLWVGRTKDWHRAKDEVAAGELSQLLLSDGIHWAGPEDEARFSIEDCFTNECWEDLQSLLLDGRVAP